MPIMAPPPVPVEEKEEEEWLVTYADAITLLLAFFVMLITFAKFDIPAYQEAANAIKNEVGKKDEKSPTEVLQQNIQMLVENVEADQVVQVTTDDKGIAIELASNAFFKPGSADLREVAIEQVLKPLTDMLAAPRYGYYMIDAEGHTDDDPISTERFPSNWDLSAARASTVIRFFIDYGQMNAKRFRVTGLGSVWPKVPNRDAEGNPIKENQAENRRVLVRVFPMSLEERKAILETGVSVQRVKDIERIEEQGGYGGTSEPGADDPVIEETYEGSADEPAPDDPVFDEEVIETIPADEAPIEDN